MNIKEPILGFQCEYRWLSNFAPCDILYDGAIYPSVENAYVAAKTLNPDARQQLETCSPNDAKSIGRMLPLRKHWDQLRVPLMRQFLIQKYNQEPYRQLLINTEGRYIEETNWWNDQFWGVCGGKGENILGVLIMDIRDLLTNVVDSV